MKVLVAVKRIKSEMNPFDEIAVEEAVKLKERGIAKEVIVVSIGKPAVQEIIRAALARGADRGLWVETEETLQPLAIAKILKSIAEQELPQIILLGKQAVDDDNNQTGQMLAGLLNWPQGTFASKLEIENNSAKVTREVDGGLETLLLKLPAVITTDLRLNEPRYLSLPNIVQAKKKPITAIPQTIKTQSKQQIINTTEPEKQRLGIRVNSVTELLAKIRPVIS